MRLRQKRRFFSVPLCSMADIAFLLLIFIMLVSLINFRREAQIQFPVAEAAARVSAEQNLEIWIDLYGNLYLDGELSNLALVEWGIVDAYQRAPDTRVHIIADRYTAFQNVHMVLDILQLLEHRQVSFVVRNE